MKNVIKRMLEQELRVDENHNITGIDNAVDRLAMWFRGDIGLAALNLIQREAEEEVTQPENICKCCGKKMKTRTEPEYICMNPYCDNYIKITKNEVREITNHK